MDYVLIYDDELLVPPLDAVVDDKPPVSLDIFRNHSGPNLIESLIFFLFLLLLYLKLIAPIQIKVIHFVKFSVKYRKTDKIDYSFG